jgi:type 1 glutamine amidotransferase
LGPRSGRRGVVACHSGHLDAVRELIDGTTWLGGNPYAA